MFDTVLKKVFGTKNDRELKKLWPRVAEINALEAKYEAMTQEELQACTQSFRDRLKDLEGDDLHEALDDILHDAFAIVREGGKRALGMRHYDVQMIGGMVLHQSKIAEMKTGEGKTLVATLPVYLNALAGRGVHVITVNDYLAKRDAEWMGRVYRYLGLEVGVIVHGLTNQERQAAYRADITYGTNSEFGFDYLRDNMKYDLKEYVQRDLFFCIVDEVDSILVDEARTPLIISGPAEESTDLYGLVNAKVRDLVAEEKKLGTDPTQDPEEGENPGKYFSVDLKHRSAQLTEDGIIRAEELLGVSNMYAPTEVETLHHVQQALRAHTLYQKDVDYVVKDGEVIIVDEFTGRTMEGRRWSDGLHQAVEAKEGVQVENENQTLATITYQNYFKMYDKIAGMTGTAETEAAEFHEIYSLDVVVIPTNEPIARDDMTDLVFKTEEFKYKAIVEDVREINKEGAPVLIGTTSIEKSELLSKYLIRAGIRHNVLNAKQHAREAEIVAQAGRKGAVTIATNMAGRGTDIMLGGNPEAMAADEVDPLEDADGYQEALVRVKASVAEEKKVVLEAGGLHIIGTERHESRRVDNQLRGRSGRQGDPGVSRFYLSLEDDLLKIFGGDRIIRLMERLGMEDEAIEHPLLNKSIESAQQKVEARNFEIRKNLLEYDDVMNQQRTIIYKMRRRVLGADKLDELLDEMRQELAEDMLDAYIPAKSYPEDWDWTGIKEKVYEISGRHIKQPSEDELEHYKEDDLHELISGVLGEVFDSQRKTLGDRLFPEMLQFTMLQVLDHAWKEHLLAMDHLKEGIHLRGYAQKDPKREYQREGYEYFLGLLARLRHDIVQRVCLVRIAKPEIEQTHFDLSEAAATDTDQINLVHQEQETLGVNVGNALPPEQVAALRKAAAAARSQGGLQAAQAQAAAAAARAAQQQQAVQPEPENIFEKPKAAPQADASHMAGPQQRQVTRVGRNDPCPCGSGKKYKQCHGRNG